jgi:hypothetical protein
MESFFEVGRGTVQKGQHEHAMPINPGTWTFARHDRNVRRPEGASQASPGQRPGFYVSKRQALKGRSKSRK